MSEPTHLSATRTAYDTVADDYAELLHDELDRKPLDRAMLASFAELVQAGGGGPVADLGCGPGRVTAHLTRLGLDAFGVDLSPRMIAVARRSYPRLRFDEGSILDLDVTDGALAGLVAWYSIIHTPPELLSIAFDEFARVLAPGGQVLLAFQVGDERRHIAQGYGHAVSLDAYRLPPDHVSELMARAGLLVQARLVREPDGHESVPQAYLLAARSGSSACR